MQDFAEVYAKDPFDIVVDCLAGDLVSLSQL